MKYLSHKWYLPYIEINMWLKSILHWSIILCYLILFLLFHTMLYYPLQWFNASYIVSACTNSTACYTSVTMRFDLILATGGSRSLGHVPLLHSSLPNHTAVDLFVQQVKSEFGFRIIALFFVVCRYLSLYRMSFVCPYDLSLFNSISTFNCTNNQVY